MSQTVADQIHAGLGMLGLELAGDVEARLRTYLALLAKWNRVYNLTAVRTETAMVSQHLLDSLALLPHIDSDSKAVRSLADVGSGGGLPGIPLAIALGRLNVHLIESSHKKASFLQQAKIELSLDNVSIHYGRVESFKPSVGFDIVVSRAFSRLAEFVRLAAHLLAPTGRLMAMKGAHPQDEIDELTAPWRVSSIVSLAVPGQSAQRELIVIEKA